MESRHQSPCLCLETEKFEGYNGFCSLLRGSQGESLRGNSRMQRNAVTERQKRKNALSLLSEKLTIYIHTLFCHTNEIKIQYKITRKEKWRGDLKETIESL